MNDSEFMYIRSEVAFGAYENSTMTMTMTMAPLHERQVWLPVAFVTIGDLIREAIVPPRTAAALYRAAALIPGVIFAGHVTNAKGQPGVAIARTNGQSRQEWIFDPATLQFVGELALPRAGNAELSVG